MASDVLAIAPEEMDPSPVRDRRSLRFAEFELSAESYELHRRDRLGVARPVRLQPQPAKVLLYLAERSGSLVTRGELQRHVWGENHFVDYDQGLNYCIRVIRRALGDDASSPRFVETVPRRGYRFKCRVEVSNRPPWPRGGPSPDPSRRRSRATTRRSRVFDRRTAILLGALGVLSVALHWALSAGLFEPTRPLKLAVLPFEDHTGTRVGRALAGSLTDELISNLAGGYPEGLRVIARDSSLAYAGRGLTAAQLGRQLDADYLLTGGLQISGDGARVTVQLIEVRDETNLWAEIYERPANPEDWEPWLNAVRLEVAARLALPAA